MKIGIFTDTYLPDINGVASSSYILRNALEALGHEVIVVTTELKKGDTYQDIGNVYRLSGIEVKQLYDYRLAQFFSLKAMHMLKEMNLDVIHIQTEFSVGIFGKIVARLLNIPVVYTYHTQYEDYIHYAPIIGKMDLMQPLLKKAASKVSQLYGDNCTELIAPSVKTKEMLEGYGVKKHIYVIPTGLELHRFEKSNIDPTHLSKVKEECGITDDLFTLIFLGRIAPEKSVDLVISSLPLIIETNKNIRLVIVGGGPGVDDLKQLTQDLNLVDYVYFAGPKPANEVPYYYHASNAFVSASISETQGLTYIEAMAASIPVLARYDKNLEGIIQEGSNGYFFDSKEQLAKYVLSFMDQDLSSMKQQAYTDSRQYSSETFGMSVLEVYYQAIIDKHYTYKVEHIIGKANNICDVILKFDQQTITCSVPEKFVIQSQIEEGQVLEHDKFEEMQTYEIVVKGYNQALKYLTIKDYTKKQMRDKLIQNKYCDPRTIEIILKLLEEKNLIDDSTYAKEFIQNTSSKSLGFRKVLSKLKEKGIQDDIIEEIKNMYSFDLELQKAISLVKKTIMGNQSKSKQALKKKVADKLFLNGFDYEVIQTAIESVSFDESLQKEKEILYKEYEKGLKKYQHRYNGKELANKMFIYLSRKGFEYDMIKSVLEEGEDVNEY